MKFWVVSIVLVVFVVGGVAFLAGGYVNKNKTGQNSSSSSSSKSMKIVTQLEIEDLVMGTGAVVEKGDSITIHYKGTLLDGTKFDSSYDRGQPFGTQIGVGQVIAGWDQGIVGMKIGGKRKLTIPSDLAYGSRGAGASIPPNSALIFETELLAIQGK